jgi:hypothetical protein
MPSYILKCWEGSKIHIVTFSKNMNVNKIYPALARPSPVPSVTASRRCHKTSSWLVTCIYILIPHITPVLSIKFIHTRRNSV